MTIQGLADHYQELADKLGPAEVGKFVVDMDDVTAKELHDELIKRGETRLVRPLWYNYRTQAFRWGME